MLNGHCENPMGIWSVHLSVDTQNFLSISHGPFLVGTIRVGPIHIGPIRVESIRVGSFRVGTTVLRHILLIHFFLDFLVPRGPFLITFRLDLDIFLSKSSSLSSTVLGPWTFDGPFFGSL